MEVQVKETIDIFINKVRNDLGSVSEEDVRNLVKGVQKTNRFVVEVENIRVQASALWNLVVRSSKSDSDEKIKTLMRRLSCELLGRSFLPGDHSNLFSMILKTVKKYSVVGEIEEAQQFLQLFHAQFSAHSCFNPTHYHLARLWICVHSQATGLSEILAEMVTCFSANTNEERVSEAQGILDELCSLSQHCTASVDILKTAYQLSDTLNDLAWLKERQSKILHLLGCCYLVSSQWDHASKSFDLSQTYYPSPETTTKLMECQMRMGSRTVISQAVRQGLPISNCLSLLNVGFSIGMREEALAGFELLSQERVFSDEIAEAQHHHLTLLIDMPDCEEKALQLAQGIAERHRLGVSRICNLMLRLFFMTIWKVLTDEDKKSQMWKSWFSAAELLCPEDSKLHAKLFRLGGRFELEHGHFDMALELVAKAKDVEANDIFTLWLEYQVLVEMKEEKRALISLDSFTTAQYLVAAAHCAEKKQMQVLAKQALQRAHKLQANTAIVTELAKITLSLNKNDTETRDLIGYVESFIALERAEHNVDARHLEFMAGISWNCAKTAGEKEQFKTAARCYRNASMLYAEGTRRVQCILFAVLCWVEEMKINKDDLSAVEWVRQSVNHLKSSSIEGGMKSLLTVTEFNLLCLTEVGLEELKVMVSCVSDLSTLQLMANDAWKSGKKEIAKIVALRIMENPEFNSQPVHTIGRCFRMILESTQEPAELLNYASTILESMRSQSWDADEAYWILVHLWNVGVDQFQFRKLDVSEKLLSTSVEIFKFTGKDDGILVDMRDMYSAVLSAIEAQ